MTTLILSFWCVPVWLCRKKENSFCPHHGSPLAKTHRKQAQETSLQSGLINSTTFHSEVQFRNQHFYDLLIVFLFAIPKYTAIHRFYTYMTILQLNSTINSLFWRPNFVKFRSIFKGIINSWFDGKYLCSRRP